MYKQLYSFKLYFLTGGSVGGIYCEHYNLTKGEIYHQVLCRGEQNLCFALWHNASGVVSVHRKGCWTGEKTLSDKCIGRRADGNMTYCICKSDMCNANFTFAGDKSSKLCTYFVEGE